MIRISQNSLSFSIADYMKKVSKIGNLLKNHLTNSPSDDSRVAGKLITIFNFMNDVEENTLSRKLPLNTRDFY